MVRMRLQTAQGGHRPFARRLKRTVPLIAVLFSLLSLTATVNCASIDLPTTTLINSNSNEVIEVVTAAIQVDTEGTTTQPPQDPVTVVTVVYPQQQQPSSRPVQEEEQEQLERQTTLQPLPLVSLVGVEDGNRGQLSEATQATTQEPLIDKELTNDFERIQVVVGQQHVQESAPVVSGGHRHNQRRPVQQQQQPQPPGNPIPGESLLEVLPVAAALTVPARPVDSLNEQPAIVVRDSHARPSTASAQMEPISSTTTHAIITTSTIPPTTTTTTVEPVPQSSSSLPPTTTSSTSTAAPLTTTEQTTTTAHRIIIRVPSTTSRRPIPVETSSSTTTTSTTSAPVSTPSTTTRFSSARPQTAVAAEEEKVVLVVRDPLPQEVVASTTSTTTTTTLPPSTVRVRSTTTASTTTTTTAAPITSTTSTTTAAPITSTTTTAPVTSTTSTTTTAPVTSTTSTTTAAPITSTTTTAPVTSTTSTTTAAPVTSTTSTTTAAPVTSTTTTTTVAPVTSTTTAAPPTTTTTTTTAAPVSTTTRQRPLVERIRTTTIRALSSSTTLATSTSPSTISSTTSIPVASSTTTEATSSTSFNEPASPALSSTSAAPSSRLPAIVGEIVSSSEVPLASWSSPSASTAASRSTVAASTSAATVISTTESPSSAAQVIISSTEAIPVVKTSTDGHVEFSSTPPTTAAESISSSTTSEPSSPPSTPSTSTASGTVATSTTLSPSTTSTSRPPYVAPVRHRISTTTTTTTTTTTPRPTVASVAGGKDPIGVKLLLFSKYNTHAPYALDASSLDSLRGAHFTYEDFAHGKLRVVIHGLNDGVDAQQDSWMRQMKSRLLNVDPDSNVVLVDWSRGASINLLSDLRFASVRMVGQHLVTLVRNLQLLYGGPKQRFGPEDVHVIAHSFGTFAADVLGRNVAGLGRISGLDPGGVANYDQLPVNMRLDATDARFVDVIHTDSAVPRNAPPGPGSGGMIVSGPVGLLRVPLAGSQHQGSDLVLGHRDFYPNGGYSQPGCATNRDSLLAPLRPLMGDSVRRALSCNHFRAVDLYLESIRSLNVASSCNILAYKCSNYTNFVEGKCAACSGDGACAPLGFYADHGHSLDPKERGDKYFVTTNPRKPFCLYHYGVAVKISKRPKNSARGGVLLLSLDGEYSGSDEPLELRLIGGLNGFKAGKTVKGLVTHHMDVGAVKSATLSWVPPPPSLGQFFSQSTQQLYIQAVRVYPMSFGEAATRRTISRSLCPPEGIGPLSPFFKEISFKDAHCHPHLNAAVFAARSEDSPAQDHHHGHHQANGTLVAETREDMNNFWDDEEEEGDVQDENDFKASLASSGIISGSVGLSYAGAAAPATTGGDGR